MFGVEWIYDNDCSLNDLNVEVASKVRGPYMCSYRATFSNKNNIAVVTGSQIGSLIFFKVFYSH